ncbi:MAG: hypothetical protein ABI168_11785 [Ginsengibacter sp.]
MTDYFIIPGLGNSGPDYWQTFLKTPGKNLNAFINRNVMHLIVTTGH